MQKEQKTEAVAKNVQKQAASESKPAVGTSGNLIAIIRVRGGVRINPRIEYAMELAGLKIKNTCVVKKESPELTGTLLKIKDYVTWGPIDAETYKLLKDKVKNGEKENMFHLNPPIKGFGRKGTKMSFNKSGALGSRKEKINELIRRMIKQ